MKTEKILKLLEIEANTISQVRSGDKAKALKKLKALNNLISFHNLKASRLP